MNSRINEKPDIAHIIGDINHFRKSNQNLLLFVPGRIGTSSPELGVPVSFAAINHFCAICEMSDSEVGYARAFLRKPYVPGSGRGRDLHRVI